MRTQFSHKNLCAYNSLMQEKPRISTVLPRSTGSFLMSLMSNSIVTIISYQSIIHATYIISQ